MTGCPRQRPEDIELYFYDELDLSERSAVENHLRSCTECRRMLDELSMIRSALAARPLVDAPPGGDWTGFMQRLHEAVRVEQRVMLDETVEGKAWPPRPAASVEPARARVRYAPYLAMAALLTLVTAGVVFVARSTPSPTSSSTSIASPAVLPESTATAEFAPSMAVRTADEAFAALSEQHFERSKLVVLGLASKDPRRSREADWAYERGLATSLLSDTRLYRLTAEERGMKTLAGVMGDLELVLLQTSLADAPDAGALEQIQRLIHRRNLVTKMDAVATTGS